MSYVIKKKIDIKREKTLLYFTIKLWIIYKKN